MDSDATEQGVTRKKDHRGDVSDGMEGSEQEWKAEPGRVESVLLAVTGMSPAVLTETIWALAHEKEPILPSRIIVVTSRQGRREMEERLFQPSPLFGDNAPWDCLRTELLQRSSTGEKLLRFGTTADDIRVMTRYDARAERTVELNDIRSAEDNDAAADFLLEQVRSLVENPDIRLIVSLAGGRKTMGALIYACMTLLGREVDRLTHVLVSEPYESIRDFYYPGQPSGPLRTRDGQLVNPAEAEIEMANVPFVPLRNLFARQLGRNAGTFSLLMDQCRENIRKRVGENIRLGIDQSRTEVEVNGNHLRLTPREH